MMPANLPLNLTRGDDAQVRLTFQNTAGPFDLADWNLAAVVRAKADPSLAPLASFTVVRGVTGELRLSLEEEQTLTLPNRSHWSLQATHPDTDLVQTWLAGAVRTDYRPEGTAEPNDYTVQVVTGAEEATIITTASVGPVGEKGDPGDPGLQGVSGVGVPPGGLTGQVLVKLSDDDFDTGWVTP